MGCRAAASAVTAAAPASLMPTLIQPGMFFAHPMSLSEVMLSFPPEELLQYQYISFNPHRSIGVPGARYIKPDQMYRFSREILDVKTVLFPEYWQINSLIYAFKKSIFPSPATYHLGYNKIEMTRALKAFKPECIPKTIIQSDHFSSYEALADELGHPFVCKEIRNSSGLGVYLIDSKETFQAYRRCNPILYVQELIQNERELRVVIIGDEIADIYWKIKPSDGFHSSVSRGAMVSHEAVPRQIADEIMNIAAFLNIDYAGFDVVITDTGFNIFEFNLYFGTQGSILTSVQIGNRVTKYLNRQTAATGFTPLAVETRISRIVAESAAHLAEHEATGA